MGKTQKEKEGNSTYAPFLQPIRDLATNWDIDIATELEDYLSEIQNIAYSFDGATNLNFAEGSDS